MSTADSRARNGDTASGQAELTVSERDSVLDLVHEVTRLDAVAPDGPGRPVDDLNSARRALRWAWEQTGAVLDGASGEPTAAEVVRAIGLARRIKVVEDALEVAGARHLARRLQRVRDAFGALGELTSTAAVVAGAGPAACLLGFDRAMVSEISDATWIPQQVTIGRDPSWAADVLAVGRAAPMRLIADLPESEVVRRRSALVVDDVAHREVVHRAIAAACLTRRYVAAPVVVAGRVTGLVHGDAYYADRAFDESDPEMMGLFAESLGRTLARTQALEQIERLRASLRGAAAGLEEQASRHGQQAPPVPVSPPTFPAGSPGSPPTAAGGARPRQALTARETEILRHMASGDTNGRIARRLVVSEGTVKSHVKHILRKLGAANRAEAVSIWWHSQRSTPAG